MEHNDWMPLEYPTYVKHLSRKHGNFKYKSSLPIFTWPDERYWPEKEREGKVLRSSNNKNKIKKKGVAKLVTEIDAYHNVSTPETNP